MEKLDVEPNIQPLIEEIKSNLSLQEITENTRLIDEDV